MADSQFSITSEAEVKLAATFSAFPKVLQKVAASARSCVTLLDPTAGYEEIE